MKTILVVYTNVKLTNKEIADNKLTKYAFRTSEDVEVGDLIESKDYGKSMQVTDVIDADYKFYNTQTKDLDDFIKWDTYPFLCTANFLDESVLIRREENGRIMFYEVINRFDTMICNKPKYDVH